jgi:hypothetical protein
MVEMEDAVRVLQGKYLQHLRRNQRDVHKSFNRIHGVGDQFFASVSHMLHVGLGKCLAQIVRPGFGPEMVIESTNDIGLTILKVTSILNRLAYRSTISSGVMFRSEQIRMKVLVSSLTSTNRSFSWIDCQIRSRQRISSFLVSP